MITCNGFRWGGVDLVLWLKAQPNANRDALAKPRNDRLRMCITAPPVDRAANVRLVAWLARAFRVAKSSVSIEAGLSAPLKRVRIRAPARPPGLIQRPRASWAAASAARPPIAPSAPMPGRIRPNRLAYRRWSQSAPNVAGTAAWRYSPNPACPILGTLY